MLWFKDAQKQTDVILNTILEALRSIRIVKAFTAEKKEWKKFSKDNQRCLIWLKD